MAVWPRIKMLGATIVAAGVVTLVLCQRHLGFAVLLEILVLLPWIVVSIWTAAGNSQQRPLLAAKVGIWLLSVGVVIGVHAVLASLTRAKAQKVVDAITSYYTAHGSYPVDIQAVGYTEGEVRSMVGMGGYHFEFGRPSFFYASTYVPFATNDYDFSGREWTHHD